MLKFKCELILLEPSEHVTLEPHITRWANAWIIIIQQQTKHTRAGQTDDGKADKKKSNSSVLLP